MGPDKTSGWMVMGFVNEEPTADNIRSVPVLASSSDAALLASAAAEPGFRPVGVMSERELEEHLRRIREHRAEVLRRQAPRT